MICKLRMSGSQYMQLQRFSLSPIGADPGVLGLCGRLSGNEVHALCVREFHELARGEPARDEVLRALHQRAEELGWGIVSFHCSRDVAGASALMKHWFSIGPRAIDATVGISENGRLEGWWLFPHDTLRQFDLISIVGDDLRFWFPEAEKTEAEPGFKVRFRQAFGACTTTLLARLTVAVVGCSGTGSLVVEQLARSGVGRFVLVDPDRVEHKNLNRILNTTVEDARLARYKVEVAADAVTRMGLGTTTEAIPHNLMTIEAVRRVAECDVLFGCVDGAEGRFLMNKLASFYSIPYIDVGVRLDADGKGGISQICGTVHYLRPGESSLLSRGAITMEAVEAEGLRRTNPEAYEDQVKSKYIVGVQEDRPAVISVNMHYASLAVIELLARLHSFRVEGNGPFAQLGSSLTDPRFEPMKPDGDPCVVLGRHVGRGDTNPLLDNPYLSEEREAE
jgi:hypothetical protein